jgi:hypothetical protein
MEAGDDCDVHFEVLIITSSEHPPSSSSSSNTN